ncbi:MAG: tetratricopeptide repeat protein [Planctomycetes bacterium]|nr:tetratricopeptide repeat protein [Planctomycetota bacterium]
MKRTSRTLALLLGLALPGACAAPPRTPDPPLSERAIDAAEMAYRRGNLEQAIEQNRRALRAARAQDDAGRIATSAYNLAACLLQEGRTKEAWPRLREARRELERAGEPVVDVVLLQAEAKRIEAAGDEALALAQQVLDDPAAPPAARAQARIVRARVAIDRRDADAARAEVGAADADRAAAGSATLEARFAALAGAIDLIERQPARAAEHFDREARHLAEAGHYAGMARALGRAGRAYKVAGVSARAADRLYRAARTLAAQGQVLAALPLVDLAMEAAVAADDPGLAADIRLLLDEIERAAGAAKGSARNRAR